MAKYSVALYGLQLKEKESEKLSKLDQLMGGVDLFTLLQGFCRQQKTMGMQTDEAIQRTTKLIDFCVDENKREIYGTYEKGDYGTRRRIYNVETDKQTYTKSDKESMPEPFYFSIVVPREETRAYLSFQRISNRSIQTDFVEELNSSLNGALRDRYHKPLFGNILTQSTIRNLLSTGHIGEVRLIARQIPKELFTLEYGQGYTDVQGKVELSIKAGRNGRLPFNEQIMKVFDTRGMNVSDIFTFEDLNFEYDEAKVQISEGGRDLTVDLSNFNKMRPYYVVSENIELDENGHPSTEALHAFALSIINEYRRESDSELGLE